MAITYDTFFIAQRLFECLTEGNTDVFYGVMRIYVQVAFGFDTQVKQAMARNLFHHVIKKRHTGFRLEFAGTVEVE
ncbi:hypothetical protein COL154_014113 [Colletotrichum chrysophilum]|nr:hypothetical protein COL154_014113 [Colletotrichum chrysophilum]